MERQYPEKDDKLRARFTSWLTTLLRRARIEYLRRLGREPNTIAIDVIDEHQMAAEDKYFSMSSEFQFEEERLAQAFFFFIMVPGNWTKGLKKYVNMV